MKIIPNPQEYGFFFITVKNAKGNLQRYARPRELCQKHKFEKCVFCNDMMAWMGVMLSTFDTFSTSTTFNDNKQVIEWIGYPGLALYENNDGRIVWPNGK